MEAKIRETGEIINVVHERLDVHGNCSDVSFWCQDKSKSYPKYELDFNCIDTTEEQSASLSSERRFIAAKDFMAAMITTAKANDSIQIIASRAIKYADELLSQLSKNEQK